MSLFRTVAVASLICILPATAQQPKDIASAFAHPPKQFGPLARWWWPGNDVDSPELRREIEMMDTAGFAGAEIQPFDAGVVNGLSADATKRMNEYPSTSFFNHVADSIAAAKQHGMFIDYTFGSGWPFGGSEITPELTTVELRWSHRSLQGPGLLHTRLEVPTFTASEQAQLRRMPDDWQQRLERRAKIVAVVAVRGSDVIFNQNQSPNDPSVTQTGVLTSESVILTDKMQPDGTLEWNIPAGTWQVFVFRSMPTLHRVHHGVGAPIQLEMDHWNKAAFEAHAKAIGDDGIPVFGKYFGDGMRAIFCDSLEIANNFYWSDNFIEEFKRRRGYDITPYLPVLKTYGKGPRANTFENLQAYDVIQGDVIRRDYEQTLSELMIENFFNPFNAWAHDHNLLARVQSHGAAADISKIYRDADIPETEDLAEGGTYQFLKLASSAAHVSGKHQVGSESFVWAGSAWQSTPLKIKRAADELLTAGVNAILYHGYAYRIPGFAAPGWAPFATPERKGGNFTESYNEQNTFWPYLPALNEYIRRVQYVSQTGTNVAQIAFFRSDISYNRHDLPEVPEPTKQAIMSAGYNYDDIDEDSLLHATVASRKLHTAAGTTYSALILPTMHQMSSPLAAKLRDFSFAGLSIVFAGEVANQANTLLEAKSGSAQMQASLKSVLSAKYSHHAISPHLVAATLNSVEAPNVRFDGEALPYLESTIGDMHFFFFRNASDEAKDITIHLRAAGKLETWDPWTGKSSRVVDAVVTRDSVTTHLHVAPVGSALLVVTPVATATEDAPSRKIIAAFPVGNQGWQLTATGMGPQGKAETVHRDMPFLTDWTSDPELKFLSGNGVYTTAFDAPASAPGQHIELQLGSLGDAASIKVNGKFAGQAILPPYAVDVTGLLQPGHNTLEITVTNALYNALSQRKPEVFSPGKTYTNSGLIPSGLIGPVMLTTEK